MTVVNPLVGLPISLTGATAATRYVGGTASGAPTTGTFAVGDVEVDQSGVVWVCTVAGTPGTWQSQAATELGYAQITANWAVTSSLVAVTGLSTTVTVGSRPVKAILDVSVAQISTAGNFGVIQILEDGVQVASATYGVGSANEAYPIHREVRRAPAAGSHTYSVSVQGTGTIGANDRIQAGANSPAFIEVVQI